MNNWILSKGSISLMVALIFLSTVQTNLKMLKQFYLCTQKTFVLVPVQFKLFIKDNGEKLFSCDTCEKSLPVKSSLTKHKLRLK